MSNLSSPVQRDDLVISKQDGEFYSGGFNVSSILKQGGGPVMNTFLGGKKDSDADTDIFELFKNLSIPRGIFSMKTEHFNSNHNATHKQNIINNDDHLEDDLVDKLLKLVEPIHNNKEDNQLKHKKTKKHINKNKKNKTKKQ